MEIHEQNCSRMREIRYSALQVNIDCILPCLGSLTYFPSGDAAGPVVLGGRRHHRCPTAFSRAAKDDDGVADDVCVCRCAGDNETVDTGASRRPLAPMLHYQR